MHVCLPTVLQFLCQFLAKHYSYSHHRITTQCDIQELPVRQTLLVCSMILAPRKHLFATNIVIFFVIYILQKCLQIFCIIEEKACKKSKCSSDKCNDELCVNSSPPPAPPSVPSSPTPPARGLKKIPVALRKTMRNFGYGEGHYQIFVEEKQRIHTTSKARLNAAVAEVKLNPN